jgi:prophage regulatory protein
MHTRTEERLIRLPEFLNRVGYKRSHAYRLMNVGKLPKPLKLPGGRAIAWPASVVDKFIADQIAASSAA